MGFRVRARERRASALCRVAAAAVPAATDQVEQGRVDGSAARVHPVAAAAPRRVAAGLYLYYGSIKVSFAFSLKMMMDVSRRPRQART